MVRFASIFLAVVIALFALELTQPVQRSVVIPFTEGVAAVSAGVTKAFDSSVTSHGNMLMNSRNGFAVSIEAGCNGVEASILLVAAMLAFRATWRQRIAGILIGVAAIQALNLVRIVSLFYLGQWSMAVFEWAHLYLWQVLIMLDVLVVWLLWMRWVSRAPAPEASAA